MLGLLFEILENMLYYRPSRVLAWAFGVLVVVAFVIAVVRPAEMWFGFVLSPALLVCCVVSVLVGNWFEAYAESRERERQAARDAETKAASARPKPVRGFPVVLPKRGTTKGTE